MTSTTAAFTLPILFTPIYYITPVYYLSYLLFTPINYLSYLLFTPIYYLPPFTISIYPHLLLYPFTVTLLFLGIKTRPKYLIGHILSLKHSNSTSKMKRIKISYVEVFEKFEQNTRQHCFTKLGKKPKITIFRCL